LFTNYSLKVKSVTRQDAIERSNVLTYIGSFDISVACFLVHHLVILNRSFGSSLF
jgi:hypothetical protein